MIGMSNGQTELNRKTFNNSNTYQVTVRAGEDIQKGDFVNVMSIDAPLDNWVRVDYNSSPYNTQANDSLGSYGKPFHPLGIMDKGKNTEIFCCFHMATNAWQGKTGLYFTKWDAALDYLHWTPSAGTYNVQLHTIDSYSWGQPVDIGNGYWLIPGQGSSSSGVAKNGKTYSNASQVILAYVDPGTGQGKRIDVDFTWGGANACHSGKPVIAQVSDNEFVMLWQAVVNQAFHMCAQHFTVTKDEDAEEIEFSAVGGSVKFSEDVLVWDGGYTSIQRQYAHCGWFVDKEKRELLFLSITNDLSVYNYAHLMVDSKGHLTANPTKALTPIKSSAMQGLCPWYNPNQLPMVMDYYNNFGLYNTVKTSDNKHMLVVMPYYYYDIEADFETATMKATIRPLWDKNSPTASVIAPGINSNRWVTDFDASSNHWQSSHCNNSGSDAWSRVPFLWELSNNRFLMTYTGYVNGQSEGARPNADWRMIISHIIDFDDTNHRLHKTTRYLYAGGWSNGTSWPEPYYVKPYGYTNNKDRICQITTRYVAAGNWFIYGNTAYQAASLPESVKALEAWVAGGSDEHGRLDSNMQRIAYSGIALNKAYAGEDVTIQTFNRLED